MDGVKNSENGYLREAAGLYAACLASRLIPGAWDAWRGYRGEVTDYVIQNSLPGTSLAVFGAGRCNDLDLGRLLGHFSQVALLDVDETAMWEAVGSQIPQELGRIRGASSRIKIFPVDFVGIPQEDYIAFARLLLGYFDGGRNGEGEAVSFRALSGCLSRMYEKSRVHTAVLPQQYDYAVALGVHSQLGNVPAWLLCAAQGRTEGMRGREGAWQEGRAALLRRMEAESIFFAERLNALILSAAERKVFIGCEVSRVVPAADGWQTVPYSAVTGAWQAVLDVQRLARVGCVRFEHYLDIVWPFCAAEGKAYRMMVMEVGR